MRNTVIVLLAIVTIAAFGCNRKKEIVLRNPAANSSSTSNRATTKSPPPLQRAGGPVDQNTDEKDAEESKDETATTDEGSDTKSNDEPTTPVTAAAPPRPSTGTAAGRIGRRSPPSLNRAGGGAVADSAAPQTTAPRQPPPTDNSDDIASNDQPTPPVAQPDPEPTVNRKSFFEKATIAFKNEHENPAFQYLYAHALTEDGALSEHPVNWYNGLREPRLALRWGVGIVYHPASRWDGDPPRIGDPVDDSTNNRGGGGGSDTGDTAGGGGGARSLGGANRGGAFGNRGGGSGSGSSASDTDFENPRDELDYYTGEFGEKFINRFETRRTVKGFYGDALKDIDVDATFETTDNSTPNTRSPAPPGGGDDMAVSDSSSRRNRGGGNSNTDTADEEEYEADPTSLAPGVMMLGSGTTKSLLDQAKANRLDLLVVFDVQVTRNRNKTSTKVRATLHSAKGTAQDKPLAGTKRLSNVTVWNSRGGSEDIIEEELDKIFEDFADAEYVATDFPEWISEKASARANWLAEQEHENPLPVLVELKALHERGWLTREDYINAVQTLIGEAKANDLIDGDIAARDKAIDQWLPENFDIDAANSFR